MIVLWQRKSVWISFYHNIFNYWCQIKDSYNQSLISQKIIGHGTPQSDYNVMMCAIGLGWHTSILKMNSSLLGLHWYFMLAMMIYILGVNFVFESNTCIKTHNYSLIQKVIVFLLLYGLIYKSNTQYTCIQKEYTHIWI